MLQDRLLREITLVLLLKLVILGAIWAAFVHGHRVETGADSTRSAILGSAT